MSKKNVSCYIDGFNLYHAIDAIRPKQDYLKWVNLWNLTEAFLKRQSEQLTHVYYFSALAYWLTEPKARHLSYIKANSHFGITPILGHFKQKDIKCHNCNSSWITHEEKQSDVNIAAYLIHHAHLNNFDKAFVISADSDLCQAIDLLSGSHPHKEINILVPPGRYNITRELRTKVTSIKIKQKHLKNNQLPDTIIDQNGQIIATRPHKYR